MEDIMFQSGKIYVVTAVIAAVFIGFITYLFLIDKKVSRLEKELKEKEK